MNSLFSVVIGSISTFIASSTLTWSSSAIPELTNNITSPFGRAIEPQEATWLASSLTLGCSIGVIICCCIATFIGTKNTILIAGLLLLVGNVLIAFGKTIEVYYVARIILGLAVAAVFFLLPSYAMEMVHKSKRIKAASCVSIAACSGFLYSNVLGLFTTIRIVNLILVAMSLVFLVLFSVFAKEPTLFNVQIVSEEISLQSDKDKLRVIEHLIDLPVTTKNKRFYDIYKSRAVRKAFLSITGLLIIQQLSGIDVVLFYGTQLLQNFDASITPEISVIIIRICHLATGFILPVVGPKFNNRTLLIFSGLGMAFVQICLAVFTYIGTLYELPKGFNTVPFLLLLAYVITYNSGFGAIPFVFLGEMFPSDVKYLATSIIGTIHWVVAFLITKNFYNTLNLLAAHGYFLFCSMFCIVGVIFTKFYIIETRDRSLPEIHAELEK